MRGGGSGLRRRVDLLAAVRARPPVGTAGGTAAAFIELLTAAELAELDGLARDLGRDDAGRWDLAALSARELDRLDLLLGRTAHGGD